MKTISKVDCKFGRNDIRTVKFVATKRMVRVTCKGKPVLRIIAVEGGFLATSTSKQKSKAGETRKIVTSTDRVRRSPERAYKDAVKTTWQ